MKTQRVKGVLSREIDMVAGIPNLPSDNMAEIMRNKYFNEYVEQKKLKDEIVK